MHWIPIHTNSVIKSHKICYKMGIDLHDIKYNICISDMNKVLIIKQFLGIKKNIADHIQITPFVSADIFLYLNYLYRLTYHIAK